MRRGGLAAASAVAAVAAAGVVVLPAVHASSPSLTDVTVLVDAARTHQTIEGFGAAYLSLADGGTDALGGLRSRTLTALFQDVHLSTGFLDALVSEGTGGRPANDDGDPNHFEWSGFQTSRADAMKASLLERPEAAGLETPPIGQRISLRWGSPWLTHLRHSDFSRYLDEAAEQVAAGLTYWRDKLDVQPKYVLLFNEPTTGNRELDGGTVDEMVQLITRVGRRLVRDGFPSVRFIVPNEESEQASLDSAKAILSDRDARAFVGVIGYHPYPWGSPYVSIPRILATADQGRVDAGRRSVRSDLRSLARRYGVPLWMTEVSHGDVDARSFDDLRGRAIHIHDELEYADASAYFGMQAVWDMQTHQRHYGDGRNFWDEEGSIVLVDQTTNTVQITGMGYAIGHYARWLHHGAVRLEARSSDPLVLVSAFRDDASHRLIVVVINNAPDRRAVHVAVEALAVSGAVSGEESTAAAAWVPINAEPAAGDGFAVEVPSRSVTTLAVAMRAGDPARRDR